VLRKIFDLKRDGRKRGWRKLCKEELHNSYSVPNGIRMIKSGKVRWAVHIACMGRKGIYTWFWLESQKERIGSRIILKWTVQKQDEVVRTGLIWLRMMTMGRLL
jgi:hypothetical protein